MAHIDPTRAALSSVPTVRPSRVQERFSLKIHEVSPESLVPNGDRYVVEMIEVDEKIEFGTILVVMQQPNMNPRDPMANPAMEQRGVLPAVVVTRGNGHLLGLPDHRIAAATAGAYDTVERYPADVPMFFERGDVVFVDHNARGRALRIVGREVRVVNQIDVLLKLDGMKLQREDDAWVAYTRNDAGEWVRATA